MSVHGLFGLEGTSQDHLEQPLGLTGGLSCSSGTTSSLVLSISMDEGS